MVIRNESFVAGECVAADIYDLDQLTYTREENGIVIDIRSMTRDEWIAFGPQPLDKFGSLLTLLAVKGVLPLVEAATMAGLPEESLVLEAQGWAAAEAGL